MEKILVVRAPTRVDFAGGTTDIRFFIEDPANVQGGSTLNAAIDLEARVHVFETSEPGLTVRSRDLNSSFDVKSVDEIEYDGKLDLFKAIITRVGAIPNNVFIETQAEAPPGSGLGSSAAIGVALAGALYHKLGRVGYELTDEDRRMIAETAIHAEWDLGIIGGKQDQYAAAFGGLNLWRFKGDDVERNASKFQALDYLRQRLILCYTGVSRVSGDANERMRQSYLDDKIGEVRVSLREIRGIAEEMYQQLQKGAFEKLAALMNDETRYRARLHPDIVNERLTSLITAAKAEGASAAKILGAGGGGSLLFYVEPEHQDNVTASLMEQGCQILPYQFDQRGLEIGRPS